MKIVNKLGTLNRRRERAVDPEYIILHHTAGSSLSGAENALARRGLGYHYMIDNDGTVHQYGNPRDLMFHSYRKNHNSMGISYVGGYTPRNAINRMQYDSLIELLKRIHRIAPGAKYLTGHKHIDPRTKSFRYPYKVDPYWPGDTGGGYISGENWINDRIMMEQIKKDSGDVYELYLPGGELGIGD